MADGRTDSRAMYSRQRLYADLLVVAVLIGWWITSDTIDRDILPGLDQLLWAILELLRSADFWSNAAITAARVVAAVFLATLVGGTIGIMPRYLPWTSRIVDDALIPFLTAFPGVAWAILGTVWFGATSTAVLIVQTLIVLPFALVNVAEGAKAIGEEELEMGRSFSRNRLALFWRIELPLLSPFVMASMRIAFGVCWKISLIAELFGARSGIGFMMQLAQNLGQTDRIIALCLLVVAFVIIGERLILDPLSRWVVKGASATSR